MSPLFWTANNTAICNRMYTVLCKRTARVKKVFVRSSVNRVKGTAKDADRTKSLISRKQHNCSINCLFSFSLILLDDDDCKLSFMVLWLIITLWSFPVCGTGRDRHLCKLRCRRPKTQLVEIPLIIVGITMKAVNSFHPMVPSSIFQYILFITNNRNSVYSINFKTKLNARLTCNTAKGWFDRFLS